MASRSMAQPDHGVIVGVDTHGDGHSTVYPVPQRRPDAGAFACLARNRDVTAGSGKRCGGEAYIRSPRVMPAPMPIGSRSQSVAVGPMGRSVFRRRSQRGQSDSVRFLGMRYTASSGIEGSNPSRSAFVMSQVMVPTCLGT